MNEIEEIPGTTLYLYSDGSIGMDGMNFEYVSSNSGVLNVNITINGSTKNYNLPIGQETKIDNLKNPILVEAEDDYFLINFR
ncbi:MAG: hypothetical protein IJG68_00900 [Bacilli bacterium]|nr:hypothetical protein [Bacilli bacterium]